MFEGVHYRYLVPHTGQGHHHAIKKERYGKSIINSDDVDLEFVDHFLHNAQISKVQLYSIIACKQLLNPEIKSK